MTGEDALAATATAQATPSDGELAPPVRHVGRYRIERELGAGGMGVVYAAFDPELERRVALKLLLNAGTAEARTRLLREARALARLTHPNVVSVYEVGTCENRDYVSMELVDGEALADWLRGHKRSTKQIVEAFTAAARGLAAAHAAGLVHRDFKPHNVLRNKQGRILVTDFGLACTLDSMDVTTVAPPRTDPAGFATLTATGSWIGTPAYMAPEQWNNGDVGPAADQFGFCVALFEAFAGARPFTGASIDELRAAVEAGPAKVDMSKVPRRFRSLVRRGLDPDPAKRWPDMEMVGNLLESRAKGTGWIWWTLGVFFALGMFLGVGLALGQRDSRTARTIDDTSEPSAISQITRFGDGRVKAPRAAIDGVIAELRSRKVPRLVPSSNDDGPLGFKVFALRPGTFLDAVGVGNGDLLIEVDGAPVTTEAELAAALAELPAHDATELELTLRRKSEPFTISIEDRDAR